MDNWKNKKTDALIDALLKLKTKGEARQFLRDLLTEKELIEFGNRWKAAQMLNEKIAYKEIEKETGLSSRTIARIQNWLKKGMGGYKLMLKKLNHHHRNSPIGSGLR
ncbi:MAG: YerC/YecD family TrpR-related protein [bacterium]|nr:YerC/YecD family TrpR-related protein [bacterium]